MKEAEYELSRLVARPLTEVFWYPSEKSPVCSPPDIRRRLHALGYAARVQHSEDGWERVLIKDREVDLRFKVQDGVAVSAVLTFGHDLEPGYLAAVRLLDDLGWWAWDDRPPFEEV